MKKFNVFILFLLITAFININFICSCKAEILSGNVNKEEFFEKSHIVIDGATGNPVSGAEVAIPSAGIFTKTNDSGQFKLEANLKSPVILSVQADGYKPFSVTINENKITKQLILVVTKLFGNETIIDKEIHHLGDDIYSDNSANAEDFKLKAEGAEFIKEFFVDKLDINSNPVLKIGTIIGIDTKTAHVTEGKTITTSSSSMQVYLNSEKIGEIKVNGDNQEMSLPKNLLKSNSHNTIMIKTGVNQQATSYIDYDDMEFMNLLIVF